jgi:putative ABC transport system permease protein
MSWIGRLRNRWREGALARDFDAELRFHLECRTEDNIRRGMTPEEAGQEARRHMGNLTRAREEMRAARVATWLDGLGGDIRHGVRVFARHPLLTCLAVLTLSLGIGANAAIFSVFEAVLLRPLPYPAADRLVVLLDGRTGDRAVMTPTIPELLDVRASTHGFDAFTFFDTRDFQIAGGEEPQRAVGARIDASFFSMLGVRPALGRLFDEMDARTGNAAIVVLGSGLWRRNFGADPAVVGRTLTINGEGYQIVGVLPDSFSFAFLSSASVDLFLPYPTAADYMSRSGQFANVRRVMAVARLAPGVSLETAGAELATAAAAIAAAHPELYPARGAGGDSRFVMSALPLRELLTRNSRPVLLILIGAVALLLLIACVNTAQFLLAQALEREPELALRTALGAGRARLIRQFVTEALLLAAAGGLLGLGHAIWLTGVLAALMPRATPVIGRIGLDGSVLMFLLFVTVATAGASVLAPALRVPRGAVIGHLGSRGIDAGRGRLRQLLIATEVALSVMLLVCAGLLLRSLFELQRAQGGFTVDGVTVLRMRGMAEGGPSMGNLYQRYLAQLVGIDGIDAVGVSSSVMPGRPGTAFTIIGDASAPTATAEQQASYQIVSAGYFRVLGIPLEAGRLFTDDDGVGRPPVAIVNREMARRFWADGNPLGRQIRAGEGPRAATMTIVGIVGNVRPPFQVGDVPQIYVSYRQQSEPSIVLMVRTAPPTPAPVAAIKQAIWSVEARQAVFDVHTLEGQLAQATSNQRAIATLIGGFAALALALSISGVYTVITYLVSRRFKEIAVRRAIGATGGDVMWSLAGPTLVWTLAGLIAGAAGAAAASRALRAAVSGIVPLELSLTAIVAAAYLLVVLLAIGAAARAALRIDPVVALRAE